MKNRVLALLILTLVLFCGCSFSNNYNPGNYDKSIYNVPMSEVIKASKDFIMGSVQTELVRSAFVELSEEDKWQGYIGYNWNVPSNIYGTSLNSADNKLVINGEDLGTLQNLIHHKDENGKFRKAVFEYNGYIYYVLDKETDNGSYIVLSTADDFEHICFDQEGKLESKDFSNFKIWQYYQASDGELYRNGNMGYAYTLRNVKMQDGSYATVTVSGFNYYNYGLRVWIKPSTGNDVRVDYPEKNESNTSKEFAYETKTDMDKYFATGDEKSDFIFEFTNETETDLTIYNLICDSRISNFENSIVTKTENVVVKPGETVEFNYNVKKILADFDYNYIFGNYVVEKNCNWWYYTIDGAIGNHRIKVNMTNEDYNLGEKHSYEDATPIGMDEYFATSEQYDFIFEFTNKTESDLVMYNYISDYSYYRLIKTSDFVIKPGETKKLYYDVKKIKNDYDGPYIFTVGTSQNGNEWWLTLGFFDNKHQKVTIYNDWSYDFKDYENFVID